MAARLGVLREDRTEGHWEGLMAARSGVLRVDRMADQSEAPRVRQAGTWPGGLEPPQPEWVPEVLLERPRGVVVLA